MIVIKQLNTTVMYVLYGGGSSCAHLNMLVLMNASETELPLSSNNTKHL